MTVANSPPYVPSRHNVSLVVERVAMNLKSDATWCQKIACQGRYGDPCDPLSPEAHRWGGSTAVYRAEWELFGKRAIDTQFPIWRAINHRAGGYAELNLINDRDGREALIRALREIVGWIE